MNHTLIIICADESKNAGERDYTFALMEELRALEACGTSITTYLFKVPQQDGFAASKNAATTAVKNFRPERNGEYKKVPPLPDNLSDVLGTGVDSCVLIGAGRATFATMLDAQRQLEEGGIAIDKAAYVTHVIDNKQTMDVLAECDITLVTPMSRATLADAFDARAYDVFLETTPTVPHTNHPVAAAEHHALAVAAAEKADNAAANVAHVLDWQRRGENYAVAVINAGFETTLDDGIKIWTPYTRDEAYEHGKALSEKMGKGVNLYALHGGPRNKKDVDMFGGFDPADDFMRGYLDMQGDTAKAVLEPFDPTFETWNPIKASYVLGAHDSCKAYISNAEGYGTMDGAMLMIDNRKKLLGAFTYDALYRDPSGGRQKNVEAYNNKGFTMFAVKDGTVCERSAPAGAHTPIILYANVARSVLTLCDIKPHALMPPVKQTFVPH